MSNRIRYRNISDNVLQSVQTFQHATNGGNYIVRMSFPETKWFILDAVTEAEAASGWFTKKNLAQLAIRKALKDLGIVLGSETRKRTPKNIAA